MVLNEQVRFGGRAVRGFGVGAPATGAYVSDDDYATLKAQWAARMQALGSAFDAFSATWSARDPAAFTDWNRDWAALRARYASALANAGTFTLNSTSYESLAKAMRQCYPPDGCPVGKGDWSDLFDRLTAATKAAGAPPPQDVPAHLVPQTEGEALFAETAPLDVVASLTGGQAAQSSWFVAHKTAILVGVSVVGGVVVLAVLSPYAKMLTAALPRRSGAS